MAFLVVLYLFHDDGMLECQMTKSVIAYMCRVDAEHHLGDDPGGTPVYPSVEDLKQARACWSECGIVEVEVTITRVIFEGET